MPEIHVLRLPWPPSVNTMWRQLVINGQSRTLLSADGRQYREATMRECRQQKAPTKLSGPLAVLIDAFPPDRRVRDLDNLPKAILDGLTHAGVWGDDSQIDDLRIRRCSPTGGGAIRITIQAIGQLA